MNNPALSKQVIVVRKDLELSKAKFGVQVAHASIWAFLAADRANPAVKDWIETMAPSNVCPIFTKICLVVKNEKELFSIYEKAVNAGLPASLIKDEAYTELEKPEFTACGIGPAWNEEINAITRKLQTYRG